MKITSITAGGAQTTGDRAELLTPELRERARTAANAWIKRLRLVRYGGSSMRERFTYRGESLWWFTELYLHKMRRVDAAIETILALGAAREAGAARFVVNTRDYAACAAARAFGLAHGVPVDVAAAEARPPRQQLQSALVGISSRLSRLRPTGFGGASPPSRGGPKRIAAFVHTAFWRGEDAREETYVGPVLDALRERAGADGVALVGLGPRRNFRARRWWDPIAAGPADGLPIVPIEHFAPASAIRESLQLWRDRRRLAGAIVEGAAIRAAAEFERCDLWPVLEHELRGAALIQWPWSARSMDEAGAALDALAPRVVVTYAEAGGWGRALVLEARRRGIPSAGLQHGFMYRHWLNYLHEADEMQPVGADRGFPRPDRTLVYDEYAAEHLRTLGHFPAASLARTGSARLEDLAARTAALQTRRDELRRRHGITDASQRLLVLAAKYSEIRTELPGVVDAVSRIDGLRLIIKTHPAEIPDVYRSATENRPAISMAGASDDLAELLAAADALVTKNSTVAIDALVLGVPAVVVGLPNNLSPFVEAGVMAGAGPATIEQTLRGVLYDSKLRLALVARAEAFAARGHLTPAPGAAGRAADEILALAAGTS